MRKIIVLNAFIFLLAQTFAQPSSGSGFKTKQIQRIGIQMGINLPKQVFTTINNPDLLPDFSNPARFSAGFYSESGVSEYFVTQVGVFYSGAGYKINNDILRLDYLKVPVIMNFRTPIVGPVYLQVGMGPYFGFAFNGVFKSDDIIERDILSFPGGDVQENKPYSYFDGGLIFGGSAEWVLPNSQIIKLGVSYHLGIIKVSNKHMVSDGGDPVEVNNGAKNRILSINVCYLLNLRK